MAHIIWKKLPTEVPPPGITVTVDGASVIAESPDRDALTAWQLALLKSGGLAADDLAGSGEGSHVRPPVEISASKAAALASIEALPAGATLAQLRAAVTALKGA